MTFAGMKHMDQKVTFSAGLSHSLELTEAEPVVYDRIFVNEGNGYSSRTGIFTCPQVGVTSVLSTLYFSFSLFRSPSISLWIIEI